MAFQHRARGMLSEVYYSQAVENGELFRTLTAFPAGRGRAPTHTRLWQGHSVSGRVCATHALGER
eukprot:4260524-Prymnesium_polylepis.1